MLKLNLAVTGCIDGILREVAKIIPYPIETRDVRIIHCASSQDPMGPSITVEVDLTVRGWELDNVFLLSMYGDDPEALLNTLFEDLQQHGNWSRHIRSELTLGIAERLADIARLSEKRVEL